MSFFSYLHSNVELKCYSRWKIGGKADFFSEPKTIEELSEILVGANQSGIPFQIIGDATNILFDDEGYRGLIVKIGRNFSRIKADGSTIEAESGCWTPCLARFSANHGLSGIEHTVGIPGSVGGLVIMNGGSMQKSISSCVNKVKCIDYSGKLLDFSNEECCFSYRRSYFQGKPLVVIAVELLLNQANTSEVRTNMLEILESRRKKFPQRQPNCGSVFISNPQLFETFGPPGKVIENLGLKGYTIGNAMISSVHANFIVNLGEASSSDVVALAKRIRSEIHNKTNVLVESEIRYLHPKEGFKFLHEIC